MTRKPVVLIADDDRNILDGLKKRLTHADFDVISASNAASAVALFEDHQPDAAILDVRMPDSDGLAVCQHIRESGSTIPVLFLTGAEEGIIRSHLGRLTAHVGANHFVTKPYDGEQLTGLLQEALGLASASGAASPGQ
jgi:DNA-binding response OmpR family regulator